MKLGTSILRLAVSARDPLNSEVLVNLFRLVGFVVCVCGIGSARARCRFFHAQATLRDDRWAPIFQLQRSQRADWVGVWLVTSAAVSPQLLV